MLIETVRPWGTFQILEQSTGYWVKKITVMPGKRLSLQYHEHRQERWTVVDGIGYALLNNMKQLVKAGSTVIIGEKDIHRIENKHNTPLVFIEVALGDCREEDIIRIEDDWDRK